jgi:hypothetical protein
VLSGVMNKTIKNLILWILSISVIGFTIVGVMFYLFFSEPLFRNRMLRFVADRYGLEISAKSLSIGYSHGLFVNGSEMKVQAKDGGWSLSSAKAEVQLNPFSILNPRLLLQMLRLENPVLELNKLPQKTGASPSLGDHNPLQNFRWEAGASILVRNGAMRSPESNWSVESIDFNLDRLAENDVSSFHLLATARKSPEKESRFEFIGTLQPKGNTLGEAWLECSLSSPRFDLTQIPWPSMIQETTGGGPVNITISGPLAGPIRYDGKADLTDVKLALIKKTRSKYYDNPSLSTRFSGGLSWKAISIDQFTLSGSDFELSGMMNLDFKNSNDPNLLLVIKSAAMSMDTFKRIYPDPLTNPWLNEKLFPIFPTGQARLVQMTLNGEVSRIDHMNRPENSDAFSISLHVDNVSAFGSDWGPAIDTVMGDIAISDGKLLISNVGGKIGGSTLYEGSLTIPELYEESGTGEISLKGNVDLKDLLPLKKARYLTHTLKDLIVPIDQITGLAKAEILIGVSEDWKKIAWRQGSIDVSNAVLTHQKIPGLISIDTGRMVVKENSPTQYEGTGKINASTLRFSGQSDETWDTHQLQLNVRVDDDKQLETFAPKIAATVDVVQPITCNLSMAFKKDKSVAISGSLPIKGFQAKYNALLFSPAAADALLKFALESDKSNSLRLAALSYASGTGEIAFSFPDGDWKNPTKIQLLTNRISLDEMGIYLGGEALPIQGRVSGQVTIDLKASPIPSLTGQLSFNGLLAPPYLAQPLVRGFSGEVELAGKTIDIRQGVLSCAGGDIRIEGNLQNDTKIKGSIKAGISNFDLKETMDAYKLKDDSGSAAIPKTRQESKHPPIDLAITVQAEALRWQEFLLTDLGVGLKLAQSETQIEYGRASFEGGSLSFTGSVGQEKPISLSAYLKLDPQPIEELFRRLSITKSRVKGTLNAEGLLHTYGSNFDACLRNLMGTVNFEITKGYFENDNIILKILDFLSIQNIFIKRPPEKTANEFYFHEMQGNFDIAGTQLKTDNILMKSPVFNAVAAGELDWQKDTIDVKIGTQPLGTIDYLVSKIPIVGHILTGKDKSLLVYYFNVKGSLRNPEVNQVPFESLGKNLTGYFERLLLTPVRLFKQLSDIFKTMTSQEAPVPMEQ